MASESVFEEVVRTWWESFRPRSRTRGNIAGGLVILENLRSNFDLDIRAHRAANSDQLRNATGSNVQRILNRYGEERVLLREGGRTNRGLMRNLEPFMKELDAAGLESLAPEDRNYEIGLMQAFLADRAKDILNAGKITFDYRRDITSREIVGQIIEVARNRNKAGEVAEYMVGAKLALRFPEYQIRNSAASAADEQTDEQGDFQINDCVFHVTVSPNRGHYDKCLRNLSNGYRVFLLVPDRALAGSRQISELEMNNRVSVESIESFISQNIEELSEFSSEQVARNIKSLISEYNERLSEVETDLSLQIEVPRALEDA